MLSDGETITLDEDYFQQQDVAIHARLAAPQLSDKELARRRAASPDEAWLWTRGRRMLSVTPTKTTRRVAMARSIRATRSCKPPFHEGEQHIVWLRIGTHDIFE